jgi:hypothetical protein
MARSPKGLIENRSATPKEAAQLGLRLKQISFRGFQLTGPDLCQKINELIGFWKEFGASHIETNPATDGTLDRTAAAKALLANLQIIEQCLAAAERNSETGYFCQAVYHTLLLASRVHQLAIIDNETPIVARQESIEGARRGGRSRSASNKTRNRKMALEFLRLRGGRKSDTALMASIGAANGLKRRASVEAVKLGLRDLSRD